MKREDLKKIELSDEAIDKIMAMHGADIEKQKTAAETAKTEADSLKSQLTEANKQIDGFKGMDIEGVVAVKAHLKSDGIKYNEKDDTFVGLKEQIEPLKESHGAYFADFTPPPQFTAGGNNKSILGDPQLNAMRKAAGLPDK